MEISMSVSYCLNCGWWRAISRDHEEEDSMYYEDIVRGAVGGLKELDLTDFATPLEEVRDYLAARFEARFSLGPKLFEETVASVFKSLGFHTRVTGYTRDGGIDIVLGDSGESLIGVQVKRYKDKIRVDQIRSLAGALVIAGYTKGIYVTTSSFTGDALKASERLSQRGIPVELIDAPRFYAALSIAQRSDREAAQYPPLPEIRKGLVDISRTPSQCLELKAVQRGGLKNPPNLAVFDRRTGEVKYYPESLALRMRLTRPPAPDC